MYDVGSNEELERLIALMPVYNFAHYTVYPLAEMPDWEEARPAPAPAPAPPALPRRGPDGGRAARLSG